MLSIAILSDCAYALLAGRLRPGSFAMRVCITPSQAHCWSEPDLASRSHVDRDVPDARGQCRRAMTHSGTRRRG